MTKGWQYRLNLIIGGMVFTSLVTTLERKEFLWFIFFALMFILNIGYGWGYTKEATADNSDFKTATPKLKHS